MGTDVIYGDGRHLWEEGHLWGDVIYGRDARSVERSETHPAREHVV
jgi:hypothetical protein